MELGITLLLTAFVWLMTETDWLRVRLPVGAVKQRNSKWQFQKYGDDCIMMHSGCRTDHCSTCQKLGDDRFWGWRIPARTVKVAGSTINFNEGCNLYRAKLLKDIVKAQKSKSIPHYKGNGSYGHDYNCDASIELLVDGKRVLATGNGDGEYKRGMIKATLKPYTTKIKVGRKSALVAVGEADRA